MDQIYKIPFNKPLYFKVLPLVILGIVIIFAVAIFFFDYKVTTADPFGAPVAAVLLAYIIHLGMWKPGE